MNVEEEIELLETKKENLEFLIMELEESGDEFKDKIDELKDEIKEIDDELERYYVIRDDCWAEERKEQEREYWEMVL